MTAAATADLFHDQEWRLNNLYTIRDKEGKRVPFAMNDAQSSLFRSMSYLNVILKARQLGFSTLIDLYILDTCLFNPDVKAGIIAHHKDDAEEIFQEKVKFVYSTLPEHLTSTISASTDRAGEIVFSNGSSIRVSTSFRSGTLQILHVSEYGKIAAKYPDKAKEIKTGAFEAVGQGQMIFVESTAEGREGDFFELCERSRKLKEQGKRPGKLDFKFFFFAWWQNPEYRAEPGNAVITSELVKYFIQLEGRGIKLDAQQRAWYAKKMEILGDDMRREHPSYPEEAFDASVQGAYYAVVMTKIRRLGRIGQVPHETLHPVMTFWDLGMDDSMSIWFMQQVGTQRRLIDYYESSGEGLDHYANVLKEKGYTYGTHYMPHDANVRELGTSKQRREIALQLGIRPITVTQRPKNTEALLSQIELTRAFIAGCWIDEEKCAQGIKCLDAYRKDWDDKIGAYRRTPRHGAESHGADALRTGAVGYVHSQHVSRQDLLPEAFDD